MKRIYVASKWEEKKRARRVMDELTEAGFDITHHWDEYDIDVNKPDSVQDFLTECAINDKLGVEGCDILVFLVNKLCQGGNTELGMAIAHNKEIHLVEPDKFSNIFMYLPNVTWHPTQEECIKHLKWKYTQKRNG